MLERGSMDSVLSSALQFHRTRPAYVATGGSSKCAHVARKGIATGGGIVYSFKEAVSKSDPPLERCTQMLLPTRVEMSGLRLTSTGVSPPQMYACTTNPNNEYARRHS